MTPNRRHKAIRRAIPDHVLPLCAEWWRLHETVCEIERQGMGLRGGTPKCLAQEQALRVSMDQREEIEQRIMAAPPATNDGLIAVLRIAATLAGYFGTGRSHERLIMAAAPPAAA